MTDAEKIAQTILARLGELRAGKLSADRHAMALVDLEPLARAITAQSGGETLSATGPVYVSHAAAVEYAREEDIALEPARRELTELLLDARQVAGDPTQWRMRKRSTDLDITCRVARDGRLVVVTTVHVRDRNTGGRRG